MSTTIIHRRGLARPPKRVPLIRTDDRPRLLDEEAFVNWAAKNDGLKVEWVDGEVQYRSPPNFSHCSINLWLCRLLGDFVETNDLGVVLGPEFMTRLLASTPRRRVPDILFVDASRVHLFTKQHFEGPPDVLFEIVSPDEPARDYRTKYFEYQSAGVREYWIVDPMSEGIEASRLNAQGKYELIQPDEKSALRSEAIKGFFLKPAWVFSDPRPKVRKCLREMGVR